MTFNVNLDDLSLENVGTWPNPVKVIFCGFLAIFVILLIYSFDTSPQLNDLNRHRRNENELRHNFEKKYYQSANLNEYKKQLDQMRKSLGTMLHELPSRGELPALLEDISKSGRMSGLEFRLFDPAAEVQYDFYTELPIKMTVSGDYHQFGDFVSRIASLGRIVTLHDLDIKMENAKSIDNSTKKEEASNELVMEMTAKTYRYSEGEKKMKGKKMLVIKPELKRIRLSLNYLTLILCFCVLALSGCGKNDHDKNLKKFVAEVESKPLLPLKPIPELKPYNRYVYTTHARDPFLPAPNPRELTGVGPDQRRPKEPLEVFPFDSLHMVGTIREDNNIWALITAPDGAVYRVMVGNYVGQNFGKVTEITPNALKVLEVIQVGDSWEKKSISMALTQESQESQEQEK